MTANWLLETSCHHVHGAYGMSMSSNYNTRRALQVMIDEDRFHVIRKPETS
jgi:hypothetical protein